MPKTIVKNGTTSELLPPTQLPPKFGIAVATVESKAIRLRELETEVRALKVTDAATRIRAAELTGELKKLEDDVELTMKPYKKVVNQIRDFINKKTNVMIYDLSEDLRKNVLTPMMAAWDVLEEKRAKAERDRIAAEQEAALKRQAEEKRLADEAAALERKKQRIAEIKADLKAEKITLRESKKLLTEAGAIAEADKVQAALDEQDAKAKASVEAAAVEVAPNIPTMAGNVKRRYYTFVVTDPQKVGIKYLCPDIVHIGGLTKLVETDEGARLLEKEIGGIEIREKRTY
jgi:hypothetical protein